jgi:hypothetical protein
MGTFADTAVVNCRIVADQGKHTSVFRIYIYISQRQHICCFKRKTETQAIFLNPLTICSSCKRTFVICPFDYEATNESVLFSNGPSRLNGLNGLNGLAHLSNQDRTGQAEIGNGHGRGKVGQGKNGLT